MTPRNYQLAELFDAVADAVPDRLALVAGERRLTFAQLQERARRFGNHLRDQGVGPGATVGIYARNRAEWIEAMLGAYAVRAVPVNVKLPLTTISSFGPVLLVPTSKYAAAPAAKIKLLLNMFVP